MPNPSKRDSAAHRFTDSWDEYDKFISDFYASAKSNVNVPVYEIITRKLGLNRRTSRESPMVRNPELPRKLADEIAELIVLAILENLESELKQTLIAFGLRMSEC